MKTLELKSIGQTISFFGMIENTSDLFFSISQLSNEDLILLRDNCVSRAEVEVEFEMESRGI